MSTYIEQQQHLIVSLQTLLFSFVVIAIVVTLVSAFIQRKDRKVSIALLFAALFLFACILVTRFGNFPIQAEMLTWNTNSFPTDWEMLRDRWWTFHIVRTIAELIALVLVTWTNVQTTHFR
ncbi:MAG: DUF1772 domain-containing protein [Gelidibacter sp.]